MSPFMLGFMEVGPWGIRSLWNYADVGTDWGSNCGMAESPFSSMSCLDVPHTVQLLSSENQHFMRSLSNIYILVKLLLEPHLLTWRYISASVSGERNKFGDVFHCYEQTSLLHCPTSLYNKVPLDSSSGTPSNAFFYHCQSLIVKDSFFFHLILSSFCVSF